MTSKRGRQISPEVEALIGRLIADGLGDRQISEQLGVAAPTIALRRARVPSVDIEPAVPLVIGAIRQLAAADGLTEEDLADRLKVPSARRLVVALITLGVIKQSVGLPARYGLRRDWL